MYELHSRHTNPEPQSICGSLKNDPKKDYFDYDSLNYRHVESKVSV